MTDLSITNAAVLAGGLGTRLRSVVADTPKVLATIHRRPFLAHLLDQLAAAGIRKAVMCTGYRGEQIQLAFGDDYHGMQLVYSRETAPLGTGGALRLALPLIESDSVLVMNGDSYCDVPLPAVAKWHLGRRAEATMVLAAVDDTRRYGRVVVGKDNEVLAFEEKGAAAASGWINAGIYFLSRRFVEGIPPDGAVSIEREVFPGWIGRGLLGYPNTGRFLDIGTPESYAAAEEFFAPVEEAAP
jgi:D-glycero-alpha-D-manno-heptose 1-phosphate guanylyltransferase